MSKTGLQGSAPRVTAFQSRATELVVLRKYTCPHIAQVDQFWTVIFAACCATGA